jgi:4-amino-4-deoxy-L-arabinose transferase-like glycosyltransferase
VQYPLGTGLTLALFPEGQSIFDLNRLVVLVLALTGIGAVMIAAWKKAWKSATVVMLGVVVGLLILARIGSVSFSINATLVPLLLSELLVLAALRFRSSGRTRLSWAIALAAGTILGLAILVRITTALMLPGLLLLVWPNSQPFKLKNLAVPLTLGAVLFGIFPVLWNQQLIAGAWYLPTYGRIDATPPTVSRIEHHVQYYFGGDFAAADNWALLCAVLGLVGFAILMRVTGKSLKENGFGLSWKRLALATLVFWAVPIIFFLSHSVHGLHYAMPGTFGAVSLIGFGALAIEATAHNTSRAMNRRRLGWIVGGALLFITTGVALQHVWRERTPTAAPRAAIAHQEQPLPAELADQRSWLWADLLTGTLWYYHEKPAFKIQFSDPPTRALVFRFVFDRGDQQYLIEDSERMPRYMDEIKELGGSLERRGEIDGAPYYLVHWPSTGPTVGKLNPS